MASRPLVVVAHPEEAAPIRARMAGCRYTSAAGFPCWQGELSGRPVLLIRSGPGQQNAQRAVRAAAEAGGLSCVICAGFAGALAPDLMPGDLVAAGRVLCPESDAFSSDPDLVSALSGVKSPPRRGDLLSPDRIAVDAAEKRRLAASCGALALDTESAGAARAAAELGLPFLAVRAITDRLDDDFPLDFNCYLDSRGEVRRAAVVLECLLRGRPRALWRLWRRSRLAGRRLGEFLVAFVPAASSR